MTNRINVKLVLELLNKGMSAREIQRTRHIAPNSVAKVRKAAEAYRLLFPEAAKVEDSCIDPDYEYVLAELRRAGVSMSLLHEELKDGAREEGLLCKSYAKFCRGYAEFVTAKRVTNHLDRKPGQVMKVDWSGTTMRIVDPFTDEVSKAYLFVACLPYSQMTYVEATLDMKRK